VKVSKAATKKLTTVFLGSTVEEAVKKMVDFDVECLPVVDCVHLSRTEKWLKLKKGKILWLF